jgi:ubiquinone/menaquinone biosynthesis C-methylase UbiE
MSRWALSAVLTLTAAVTLAAQRPAQERQFPPDDLGTLESPDRDEWQQSDRIMDELQIGEGSRVADVGAGGGWFTIRLARRVGQHGVVYAEDIQPRMIDAIGRRIVAEGLKNVVTVLGAADNPRLPTNIDAILIVDTYPYFHDPVTVLGHVASALKPAGRVGIVDFKTDGAGGPGPALTDRVDASVVRRDAAKAGLKLLQEVPLRYQYLLVFGK